MDEYNTSLREKESSLQGGGGGWLYGGVVVVGALSFPGSHLYFKFLAGSA